MKQLNIIISGHYFPGFQAQRYMFRLMTLSFFFLAANRALIYHFHQPIFHMGHDVDVILH